MLESILAILAGLVAIAAAYFTGRASGVQVEVEKIKAEAREEMDHFRKTGRPKR